MGYSTPSEARGFMWFLGEQNLDWKKVLSAAEEAGLGNRGPGKLAFGGDGWRAGGESGSDAEGVGALRAPEFRLEGLRS